MGKKNNYIELLRLGFPILIGQLGMVVVMFADNIMVGHYSTEALASASFVNSVFNLINFACIGFTYGLTPLAAALAARGEKDKVGAVMKNALTVNLLYILVLSMIVTMLYVFVEHLGQPEELIPLIKPYFILIWATLLPTCIFNLFSQWAYAIGNSKMPMWIVLMTNLLNIIGNYGLIYGKLGMPELGLTGAGISTLVSRAAGAVAILAIFFHDKKYADFAKGFRIGQLRLNSCRQVLTTSFPVSLQMSMETGAFSIAGVMSGWLGAIAMASFQVIVIVGTLGFCIYYSFGSAIAVLVANAKGVGDNIQVKKVAMSGYHIILILATISSTIFALFGSTLISAFTDDIAVVTTTLTLIIPLLLYQLGDATQVTFAGALRGTGNVMPMLWIAFVSYIVIGIPATYLLGFTCGLGIYGIILSFSASLFPAGAAFAYFFYKTANKNTATWSQ